VIVAVITAARAGCPKVIKETNADSRRNARPAENARDRPMSFPAREPSKMVFLRPLYLTKNTVSIERRPEYDLK
jgi:hypothetical protein